MNDLAVHLQRAERLCINTLLACDEALDREDWPALVNRLGESQRGIARLFEAQRLLLYPKRGRAGIASMREHSQLRDERDRIDVLAQLSSQAAFARDKARCRSLLAVVRDRVMTHWMTAQGCESDAALTREPARAFEMTAEPPLDEGTPDSASVI